MKTTLNKLINNQIFKYLVAGVATTLVFFVFKMLSFSALQNGVVSEVIAQTVSIIFAFVTNKFWVFEKTTNRPVARQAPLCREFSRQEYWRGLPFPPPGDLPDPGIEPPSPASAASAGGFFTTEPPGSPGGDR